MLTSAVDESIVAADQQDNTGVLASAVDETMSAEDTEDAVLNATANVDDTLSVVDDQTTGSRFIEQVDDVLAAGDLQVSTAQFVSTVSDATSAEDVQSGAWIARVDVADSITVEDLVEEPTIFDDTVGEALGATDSASAVLIPGVPTFQGGGGSAGGGNMAAVAAPWHYQDRSDYNNEDEDEELLSGLGGVTTIPRPPTRPSSATFDRRMLYLRKEMARLRAEISALEAARAGDAMVYSKANTQILRLEIVVATMSKEMKAQAVAFAAQTAAFNAQVVAFNAQQRQLAKTQQQLHGSQQALQALTSKQQRGRVQVVVALGLCVVAEKVPKRLKIWKQASYAAAAVVGTVGVLNMMSR